MNLKIDEMMKEIYERGDITTIEYQALKDAIKKERAGVETDLDIGEAIGQMYVRGSISEIECNAMVETIAKEKAARKKERELCTVSTDSSCEIEVSVGKVSVGKVIAGLFICLSGLCILGSAEKKK